MVLCVRVYTHVCVYARALGYNSRERISPTFQGLIYIYIYTVIDFGGVEGVI